jgi:imidazolonepropionase-like amidohydrolase
MSDGNFLLKLGINRSLLLAIALLANVGNPVLAQDSVLITNVAVFDGVSEELASHDVLIEANLISRVGKELRAPEGATVIDGGGRTLMPGPERLRLDVRRRSGQ